ncbi:hypothetical protein TNCV_827341 [Trichonephila clavipes]|nr:hypothetical protein TNCV_827341 [Trichonephila clavipes]
MERVGVEEWHVHRSSKRSGADRRSRGFRVQITVLGRRAVSWSPNTKCNGKAHANFDLPIFERKDGKMEQMKHGAAHRTKEDIGRRLRFVLLIGESRFTVPKFDIRKMVPFPVLLEGDSLDSRDGCRGPEG